MSESLKRLVRDLAKQMSEATGVEMDVEAYIQHVKTVEESRQAYQNGDWLTTDQFLEVHRLSSKAKKSAIDLGDFRTEGNDIAGEIAKHLTVEIEDHGIGCYEFWGTRGTDVRMEPTIQQDNVWVKMKPGPIEQEEGIPCLGGHVVKTEEGEVPFKIDLCDVLFEDGEIYLNYNIEHDW